MKTDIRFITRIVSEDGDRLVDIARIWYTDDGEIINTTYIDMYDLAEGDAYTLADEIYKATLKPPLFKGINGEFL